MKAGDMNSGRTSNSSNDRLCLRRYRGTLSACLWIALFVVSRNTFAQEATHRSSASDVVSTKEQLVRGLQALRAARAEVATESELEKPKELFLDLTDKSSSAANSESAQAMASTLSVSMTSSPTQVLMRAAAWIAIVLCVCCLAILGARRWQRERGLLPSTTSKSKVIETLSLGPSRTVSLIEMHGYRALVATDAGGIRSLVLAPATFEESLMHEQELTTDN